MINCLARDSIMSWFVTFGKTRIDFTEPLLEQQQGLRLVRLFGIYPMLTLTSIAGEIHRLIQKEERGR